MPVRVSKPTAGLVVGLHLAELELAAPRVVGEPELETHRRIPAGGERIGRVQEESCRAEVLRTEKVRRLEPEVEADRVAIGNRHASARAPRVYRADVGLTQQPPLHAHDGEVFASDRTVR